MHLCSAYYVTHTINVNCFELNEGMTVCVIVFDLPGPPTDMRKLEGAVETLNRDYLGL